MSSRVGDREPLLELEELFQIDAYADSPTRVAVRPEPNIHRGRSAGKRSGAILLLMGSLMGVLVYCE